MLGSVPASYGTLAPLADDEARGYEFVNSLTGVQRRGRGAGFGDDILAAHYRAVEHG